MTIDERFARIEHVTAGLAEERPKDREEFRALWRDTQRQLHDLAEKLAELGDRTAAIAEESHAADQRLSARLEERDAKTDQRFRETDARIDKLISAMGEFLRAIPSGRPQL